MPKESGELLAAVSPVMSGGEGQPDACYIISGQRVCTAMLLRAGRCSACCGWKDPADSLTDLVRVHMAVAVLLFLPRKGCDQAHDFALS